MTKGVQILLMVALVTTIATACNGGTSAPMDLEVRGVQRVLARDASQLAVFTLPEERLLRVVLSTSVDLRGQMNDEGLDLQPKVTRCGATAEELFHVPGIYDAHGMLILSQHAEPIRSTGTSRSGYYVFFRVSQRDPRLKFEYDLAEESFDICVTIIGFGNAGGRRTYVSSTVRIDASTVGAAIAVGEGEER